MTPGRMFCVSLGLASIMLCATPLLTHCQSSTCYLDFYAIVPSCNNSTSPHSCLLVCS